MDLQESFEALDSRAPDTYAQAVEAYCDGILRLHWNERLINKIFGRALQSHAAGRLVVQHYQWQLRGAPRPTLALLQRRMPGGARTLATFFAVLRLAGMVAVDIDPGDRRVRYLSKRLEVLKVPEGRPADPEMVFFGAWFEIEHCDSGECQRYRIVGPDETDARLGHISIDSPLARAMLKKRPDDEFEAQLPGGPQRFVIVDVAYGD